MIIFFFAMHRFYMHCAGEGGVLDFPQYPKRVVTNFQDISFITAQQYTLLYMT